MAMQSWVNREYRRGLSTLPCGAPVSRISEVEMLFSTLTTWGAHQEAQNPIAQGRVETQGLKLMMSLEGTIVLIAKL